MSETPPPDHRAAPDGDDDASLTMPEREPVVDPLDLQGPLRLPDPVPAPEPVEVPEGSGHGHRRRRRHLDRSVLLAVAGCAVVAAIGAAFTHAHPTGTAGVDVVLTMGFAAVVAVASSVARRWTGLVLAGTALVITTPVATRVLCVVALGLALHGAAIATKRNRVTGAVVGALSMQGLLRGAHVGFHGDTALVAAAVTIPVLVSAWRAAGRRTRRRLRWVVRGAAAFVALAVIGVLFAMAMARASLQQAVDASHNGLDAALAGHQAEAADQWASAAKSFDEARVQLDEPWALAARVVPLLAQHAEAVRSTAASGVDISRTAAAAATTAPYRDLRSRNGRVNVALIRRMQAPVKHTEQALERAQASLDRVDTSWLLPPFAHPLASYQRELDRALPEASVASQALDVAPGLLGGDGTRRYLILFSTPSESRLLGGFIGSWAELTADNGKLTITRHGRIGELDVATPYQNRKLVGMAGFLSRYNRFQPVRYLQNVTSSPDFPTVDRAMSQLYPQAGGRHIDGTMYADPYALAAFLKLTGPVQVTGLGYPLTSTNATQFLLHDQYVQFPAVSDRSDFLADASDATFHALTTQSLPTVPRITEALSPVVRARRLLFTSHRAAENDFLDRIGLRGALPTKTGTDFLSVRTSNANPNKIDYYLRRSVRYDVRYDPRNGHVVSTATIRLTNQAPATGLPDYVIGNTDVTQGKPGGQPRGSNRVWLNVYTDLGQPSATLDGKPLPLEVERELGHRVLSAFVLVPSGSSVTVKVHLVGDLPRRSAYHLLVASQPVVNTDHMLIDVTSDTDKAVVDERRAKVEGGTASIPLTVTHDRVVTVPFRAR